MPDDQTGSFAGRYCRITNIKSDMQIGVYGRSQTDEWAAIQYNKSHAAEYDQQWLILPDMKVPNQYCILNRLSGKRLSIYARSREEGANACIYHSQNLGFQRWMFIPDKDGFRIMNVHSELSLCVENDSAAENKTIVQAKRSDSLIWRIEPLEDSPVFSRYVRIRNPYSEKQLVIFNFTQADNGEAVIYDSSFNEPEHWIELKTKTGESVLINKFSGKALGVFARGKDDNNGIIQYSYQALPYQHWRIDDSAGVIANAGSGKLIGPRWRGKDNNTKIIQFKDESAEYQKWLVQSIPLPVAKPIPWAFNVHFHDFGIKDGGQILPELKEKSLKLPTAQELKDGLKAAKANFKTIRDLGGTMVRTDFPWKLIEPEKGSYSEEVLKFCRDYVDAAAEDGIEVLCILYQTPQWAKKDCRENSESFYENYKQYCKKVALEMKGKVRHFQIWNEPNNIFNFFPESPKPEESKDNFAAHLNLPRLFHEAEMGLKEALEPMGVAWECHLNFLLNFFTEAELAQGVIDLTFGTVVNILKSALALQQGLQTLQKFSQAPIGPIPDVLPPEGKSGFEKAILEMEALENLLANCFSWKRAVRYFTDASHAINPNNRINIYGLDHYPGTWTAREYDDWTPLADAAEITAKYDKKLAVAETGFTTWNMDGRLQPGLEGLEETAAIIVLAITGQISKQFMDILKPVLDFLKPDIINIPLIADEIKKKLLDPLNQAVIAVLKQIFLNDHTYQEQKNYIKQCLKGLKNSPHYLDLQYCNWYELKDQDSSIPVLKSDNLFSIPEMAFGILMQHDESHESAHKEAYDTLREYIRRLS